MGSSDNRTTPQQSITTQSIGDGVSEAISESWEGFNTIVNTMLKYPEYVFRGHRRNDWLLESTLTRILKQKPDPAKRRVVHLENFKFAVRGRRGPTPPVIKDDDENAWWALGQHQGLATPLLDWTLSPYAALFFAFYESVPGDETETRVVFALQEKAVTLKSKKIREKDPNSDDTILFYRPMSDENQRLVNQAGLFSRSPDNSDIESWVRRHFQGEHPATLLKFHIRNEEREECLKALGRMNLNYSTLFPDLFGASKYANMKLEIDGYY